MNVKSTKIAAVKGTVRTSKAWPKVKVVDGKRNHNWDIAPLVKGSSRTIERKLLRNADLNLSGLIATIENIAQLLADEDTIIQRINAERIISEIDKTKYTKPILKKLKRKLDDIRETANKLKTDVNGVVTDLMLNGPRIVAYGDMASARNTSGRTITNLIDGKQRKLMTHTLKRLGMRTNDYRRVFGLPDDTRLWIDKLSTSRASNIAEHAVWNTTHKDIKA
jgi:hypothetical protein